MEVKDLFLSLGVFNVHSGDQTRFWVDLWLGNKTLKDEYPALYRITRRKNVTVANVLNSRPLNVSFRRVLSGNKLTQWLQLVSKVADVALTNEKDAFVWLPNRNGLFTVKSMYSNLMTNETTLAFCRSWKIKVPLKIKTFLWFLKKGVTLTKDNLIKRNWKGSAKCCFCNYNETIQHLFFECHIAKFIWFTVFIAFNIKPPTSFTHLLGAWIKGFHHTVRNQVLVGVTALCWALWLSRNEIIFERKVPNSYLQVIFRGTYWTRNWARLSKEEEKTSLNECCQRLEACVMEIFSKAGWNFRNRIQH